LKQQENIQKYTIMKKLRIIAGLVITTVFFASCESQNVIPAEAANAPQPSRTLTTEGESLYQNQARKESLPKLNELHAPIDVEKSALSAHN
jgi:PBP1b-binding outer membrane lipoprotein LpoB